MLFKPEHKEMILSGRKTATRRNWKRPMVKVGGEYKAKLKMLSKDYFAKIKVIKLFKQQLYEMSFADVKKEGYDCFEDFLKVWEKVNGNYGPFEEVDVIEFEVVE